MPAGNADKLDGYHASEFVQGVSPYFASGETILDWANNPNGVYKKFMLASNGYPSDAPVSAEGWCELLIDKEKNRKVVVYTQYGKNEYLSTYMRSIWNNAWRENWSRPFLPLDGSVPMTAYELGINNGFGGLSADKNHVGIKSRDVANDGTNWRGILIKNATYQADIENSFSLRSCVDGVITDHTVLHTGNSAKVIVSETPLTAEGSVRVW